MPVVNSIPSYSEPLSFSQPNCFSIQQVFNTPGGIYLVPTGPLPIPVPVIQEKSLQLCLDFVNGKCKRGDQCKYTHAKAPKSEENKIKKNCQVWMLTGFCKFGKDCVDLHPEVNRESNILPPKTAKYEKQIKRKEERLAKKRLFNLEYLQTDEDPLQQLHRLLYRLVTEDLDRPLEAILRLISEVDINTDDLVEMILEQAASQDDEDNIYVYSHLCNKIVSSAHHPDLPNTILNKWIHLLRVRDGEHYLDSLHRCDNAVVLIWGLLIENVIKIDQATHLVHVLFEDASRCQAGLLLSCHFLSLAGETLKQRSPKLLEELVKDLQVAASFHSTQSQTLVSDVIKPLTVN